jgi:hypothetical protein
MAWGALQWLKITKEATFGVYNPGGALVEGTDFIWIRLKDGNAFQPRRKPDYWTINAADSFNEPVQTGTGFHSLGGTLQTLLYPTRAGFLLDAGLKRTSNDLTSYSLEFFDTVRTHRHLGCKVKATTLETTAAEQVGKLTLDWVGRQDVDSPPSLAAPASTNFPSEIPYTHQDTAGAVTINNAVRTAYSSFKLTVENVIAATRNELPYASSLYYAGRKVSYMLKNEYLSTADRAALNAATPLITNSIMFYKGPIGTPTKSVTLTLQSSNFVTDLGDDLPLDGAAYQDVTILSLYDRTAASSLTYAVT